MNQKICRICKRKFEKKYRESYEQFRKRKFCSYLCSGKNMSVIKKGKPPWNKGKIGLFAEEKHPRWKGNEVGYYALHSWVKKHLGKPNICQNCRTTGLSGHRIGWANISKKYKRDLIDWIRLCTSCHRLFDYQNVNAYIKRRPN